MIMAVVQYGLAVTPLVPLAVLGAGLAGILGIAAWAKILARKNRLQHEAPVVLFPMVEHAYACKG